MTLCFFSMVTSQTQYLYLYLYIYIQDVHSISPNYSVEASRHSDIFRSSAEKHRQTVVAAALDLASGNFRNFGISADSALKLPSAATVSRAKYRLDLFLMHCRREERRRQALKLANQVSANAGTGTASFSIEHEWISLCSLIKLPHTCRAFSQLLG